MSIARTFVAACLSLTALLAAMGAANACAERAERMAQSVKRDIPKRQVAESVGKKLIVDLERAASACKAGRVREGETIINQISKNFGYL